MSNSTKNFLNGNFKKSLMAQQKNLIQLYENLESLEYIRNKPKIEPNFPDYFYEKNLSFNHDSKNLQQYSIIYHKRLDKTKPKLIDECKKKWPSIKICENILGLKGNVS